MTIRTILVATDLSVQDQLALRRALRIAQAHRATLKLMYMPPAGEPVPATAAARLAQTALQLAKESGMSVQTVPVKNESVFEDLATEARGVDLVVLPHRRERSTAAFFRGQPVLRLLRSAGCPVLVARRGDGDHYRRMLVAVDFTPESAAFVKYAGAVDTRAELEMFHAVSTYGETRLRAAEATERAVRLYRGEVARRAREQMRALCDALPALRDRLRTTALGRGDPSHQTVVQQRRSGADLVVVGKRRSSAWSDFLSGSVAHRVLSWGTSDVLVVPDAYLQASAPIAAARLRKPMVPALALQPAGRRPS